LVLQRKQIVGRLGNGIGLKLLPGIGIDQAEVDTSEMFHMLPTRYQNEIRSKLCSCLLDAANLLGSYLDGRSHLQRWGTGQLSGDGLGKAITVHLFVGLSTDGSKWKHNQVLLTGYVYAKATSPPISMAIANHHRAK